jgi:hypothetical protein
LESIKEKVNTKGGNSGKNKAFTNTKTIDIAQQAGKVSQ